MRLPFPAEVLVLWGVGAVVALAACFALVIGLRRRGEDPVAVTHADWTGERQDEPAPPAVSRPVVSRTVADAIAARQAMTDPFPVVSPTAVRAAVPTLAVEVAPAPAAPSATNASAAPATGPAVAVGPGRGGPRRFADVDHLDPDVAMVDLATVQSAPGLDWLADAAVGRGAGPTDSAPATWRGVERGRSPVGHARGPAPSERSAVAGMRRPSPVTRDRRPGAAHAEGVPAVTTTESAPATADGESAAAVDSAVDSAAVDPTTTGPPADSATAPADSTATASSPASSAGSNRPLAVAVAHALAARAVTPSTDLRDDARDRLLAVLLDDPQRAVGAAVDLQECQERTGRLVDALHDERGELGDALGRLERAGLSTDQLARLSGFTTDTVAGLLRPSAP